MKYNIVINQLGLKDDKDITLIDASVIGWIHDFCGSNNKKVNANKVDGWTLVRGQFLVDDMPLLRIKSRSGGTRLLHRLQELGYIELKTEPRKLFVKPTSKMDKLWFDDGASEEQVEALETQVGASKQQTCSSQATYHYTNTNTDTYTNKEEQNFKSIGTLTLPTEWGKSPVPRVLYFYRKNYYDKYQIPLPTALYGRSGKVIKELLESYTEIQLSYLLIVFFSWKGMNDNNDKELNFLSSSGFNLSLFKSKVDQFEIYVKNICGYKKEFDDSDALFDLVIKHFTSL